MSHASPCIPQAVVREGILAFRTQAGTLPLAAVNECKKNLLRWYHQRYKDGGVETADPIRIAQDAYARAVFSVLLVSSFVESLFSKMGYIKGKGRQSLDDGVVAAILHAHSLKLVADQPCAPLTPEELVVDLEAALRHDLH